MHRKTWFEFHDHPVYPGFLRDLVTDALQAIWNTMEIYSPVGPRLERALTVSHAIRVIDLCSGAGGPWLRFSREFARRDGPAPEILLTDRFPSKAMIRQIESAAEQRLSYNPDPVDARLIPAELAGFRTIFSTFHHFEPAEARSILRNAFDQRLGIGIFEAAKRDLRTIVSVIGVPLLSLRLAPRIRPFRWSRIFWTWCLPLVPLTLWTDGVLSCLRSYSQADLRELISGMASQDYRWEIGEEQGGPVPVTYLLGYPFSPLQSQYEIEAALQQQVETPPAA